MSAPLPHGMSEDDYETIEAAVTETVRGRWFLGEFARRNRSVELRQILDAMARLESAVSVGQQALPPADPSIRLMMQRIKEISVQLETLSADMREAGVDAHLVGGVESQARAVAGLMRAPARSALLPNQPRAVGLPQGADAPQAGLLRSVAPPPVAAAPPQADPIASGVRPASAPRLPRADLPPSMTRGAAEPATGDPRIAALASLDALTLAQKLALFS